MKTTPAGRMDGLWKQENTAGKVQVLEGKAQRHLAGKEWFVPMSWNDHSYVTEGRRNLEHSGLPKAGSEAVWYWTSTGLRIRGLNLALGTASNSSVTWTKAISHSWTHFVPVLGPSHGQDARMDGWWTLDWQLKGCTGWGSRKRKPNLSHFTLLKGDRNRIQTEKEPKILCLQGLETVLWVPVGTSLQETPT